MIDTTLIYDIMTKSPCSFTCRSPKLFRDQSQWLFVQHTKDHGDFAVRLISHNNQMASDCIFSRRTTYLAKTEKNV